MISSIIQNTLMITSFVLVMMLLIEYINVISRGNWSRNLQGSRFKQVLITAFLGLVPGCLGGFAVVSLFTHGIVNFGALVACMIATFGDEAFVMFAAVPETAILLSLVIFLIAIATGLIVNVFVKKFPAPFSPEHFAIHHSDDEHAHADVKGNWCHNLRHLSFQRAILITGIILVIVAILLGWFEHSHSPGDMHEHEHAAGISMHDERLHDAHAHHAHERYYGDISGIMLEERWLNILFVAVSLVALFIITVVQEHFLQEHLWGHIMKHLPRIFLWTLGVLTVLQVGEHFFDIDRWVRGNHLYILLLAILIGLIPESGPHIVFITLFAGGTIPFSILLTNSIVQEGHAGLPLLAESKRGFLWMKAISVAVGLSVGLLGYFVGF
jgi:hypothetical protein